jgi:hypothetical protein
VGVVTDREEAVKAAYTDPGLVEEARKALDGERSTAAKVLADADVPHLGALAEADMLWHLHRLVRVRQAERPETGWTAALERTREQAKRLLMGNAEAQADAWQRAHAESQRKAAARFVRETDRYSNPDGEGS